MKQLYKYDVELINGKIKFTDYMGNDYHKNLYNKYLKGQSTYITSAVLNLVLSNGMTASINIASDYNQMYVAYSKPLGIIIPTLIINTDVVFGNDDYVVNATLLLDYNNKQTADINELLDSYEFNFLINHNRFKLDILKELAHTPEAIVIPSISKNIPNNLLNSFNYYSVAENAMSYKLLKDANDIFTLSKKQLEIWKTRY